MTLVTPFITHWILFLFHNFLIDKNHVSKGIHNLFLENKSLYFLCLKDTLIELQNFIFIEFFKQQIL